MAVKIKKCLIKTEAVTQDEFRTKILNNYEHLLELGLKYMEEVEPVLKRLQEKVSKSSNPFLINRYLKLKVEFEKCCIDVEIYSEYLYRNEISDLKKLKYSGIDPIKDDEK